MTKLTKEEQKKRNKEALLESYNLSKEARKREGIKKKGNNPSIAGVNRIDW